MQWLGTSSPAFHYWPSFPAPAKTTFCWMKGKSHAMRWSLTEVTPFLQSHCSLSHRVASTCPSLSNLDTKPLTCINWKHPSQELVSHCATLSHLMLRDINSIASSHRGKCWIVKGLLNFKRWTKTCPNYYSLPESIRKCYRTSYANWGS